MAEKLEVKISSEAFNALLAGVDKSKLSTEQIAALDITKADIDKAEKKAALVAKLDTLNTQLLTNVSVVNETLNSIVDIPTEINTIKLPYELMVSENPETKELSYSFVKSAAFPLEDVTFPYVGGLLKSFVKELGNQTKQFTKTASDILNTLADDEHLVAGVSNRIDYEGSAGLDIRNRYSIESAKSFLTDVDVSVLTDLDIKTGAVVFTYNSAELVKTSTDGKETDAIWSITTAKFGKTTKYKSSDGGNGRKTKISEWLPASSTAKSQKAYLFEEFSDDTQIASLMKSGADFNATQHILRIEKDKPEAERYFTNYKATQDAK